jgi:hypothetical protein
MQKQVCVRSVKHCFVLAFWSVSTQPTAMLYWPIISPLLPLWSDLRLDGGTITAARNGRTGLSFGGTGGLGNIRGIILSEHNTEGARAEDASRIAQLIAGRMTIRNNTIGIIAANGRDIRVTTEAAITDNDTDIVLIFGSRAIFTGTTIDTTTCDKTSLLRIDNVDVTCPAP